MRTKTDETLRAREEAAAGDPERARLLALTRAFKASWIDLAEALAAARRDRLWEGWGHGSFEGYCRRELLLTPATAEKLTGSYAFLASRAPDVARRVRRPRGGENDADPGPEARVPSYQAVDFWRRAEEAGAADEQTLGALGDAVLAGESPARLQRRFPEAVPRPDVAPDERAGRARAQALHAARRLADALADCEGVPRGVVKEVESALGRLVDVLRRDREQGPGQGPRRGEDAA